MQEIGAALDAQRVFCAPCLRVWPAAGLPCPWYSKARISVAPSTPLHRHFSQHGDHCEATRTTQARALDFGQNRKSKQKQPDAAVKRAAYQLKLAQDKLQGLANAQRRKPVSHTTVISDDELSGDKADLADIKTSVKVLFMGLPNKLRDESSY